MSLFDQTVAFAELKSDQVGCTGPSQASIPCPACVVDCTTCLLVETSHLTASSWRQHGYRTILNHNACNRVHSSIVYTNVCVLVSTTALVQRAMEFGDQSASL